MRAETQLLLLPFCQSTSRGCEPRFCFTAGVKLRSRSAVAGYHGTYSKGAGEFRQGSRWAPLPSPRLQDTGLTLPMSPRRAGPPSANRQPGPPACGYAVPSRLGPRSPPAVWGSVTWRPGRPPPPPPHTSPVTFPSQPQAPRCRCEASSRPRGPRPPAPRRLQGRWPRPRLRAGGDPPPHGLTASRPALTGDTAHTAGSSSAARRPVPPRVSQPGPACRSRAAAAAAATAAASGRRRHLPVQGLPPRGRGDRKEGAGVSPLCAPAGQRRPAPRRPRQRRSQQPQRPRQAPAAAAARSPALLPPR